MVLRMFDTKGIAENFRACAEPTSGFPWRTARPTYTSSAAPSTGTAAAFDAAVTNAIKDSAAAAAPQVATFVPPKVGASKPLPASFVDSEGNEHRTEEWLARHSVTGLVVLQVSSTTTATLVHEQYGNGNDQTSRCISWSTGKSVVSALFGIAVGEGLIGNIETTTVEEILPEFEGTAYGRVPLKHVLEMSSGVKFDEDYGRFFSDINTFGRLLALGRPVNEFARSLEQETESGTVNHYVSMDTQVLGCIVAKVTGMPLTRYLEEKLWTKIGAEDEVRWMLDNEKDGMELAFGTLNWRTRDAARFGWLYLNGGVSPADGTTQVVPAAWVRRSTTAGSPHTQPGPANTHRHRGDGHVFGYGYQWWVFGKAAAPDEVAGDYAAIGVYGQFIYVNPDRGIVVAMNSAFADYDKGTNELESETQAVALFRAIATNYADVGVGSGGSGGGEATP
jgi:CubicO group peptidase (beta-lactamase class C family)